MHKIDSDGATVSFTFTEGDVGLLIPATVVSAAWLNAVQAELVKVVETLGFTLNTSGSDAGDQVYTAILELYKRGGRPSPISQSIANNQASPADVTGFPQFDTTVVAAFEFLCAIFRRTDTQHVKEMGRFFAQWDSEDSEWVITPLTVFDDSGIEFVTALVSGTNHKLQYTSDDLTGASYLATAKITDIKFIRVS